MFRIPGGQRSLRIFDRVETVDPQYDIFDVGVQHEDNSIDSIVVGGSFASAKKFFKRLDERAESDAGVSKTQMQINSDEYAIKNDLPFANVDGTDIPDEEQRTVVTVAA